MTSAPEKGFSLDPFQVEAFAHVDAGRSVLVAAPTGSGKTLVADHAIDRAIADQKRAFYTTPIKALSNQKFRDLAARIGASRVGLLTGDNSINGDADVVVMTTEVLRNMLYEGRNLDDLGVVVLDEVHYLEDSYRGPVWEEVILNLPEHVRLVGLSATVSNSDEVGGWLNDVRGDTAVVVETTRPVELTNEYVVGDRRGDRLHVIPTLVKGKANDDGSRFDPDLRRQRGDRRNRKRGPWQAPSKLDLLDHLEGRDLLPVIWFVFSRKGCDEAATTLVRAGARYTNAEEETRIREIAAERLATLNEADLKLLGATSWLDRLARGVASHHAGHVPAFKEAVEVCFAEGLVRVVFATETLALGVNLPARSVVIDQLTKFTGEGHDLLTPAQFTQLTGRAGRRGIDPEGHAFVPWSSFTRFEQVSTLAKSRAFRLQSAFRPTYNMAANLLQRSDADAARALLSRSFAQYQTDKEIVRLEQRIVRDRALVQELRAQIEAESPADQDNGDILETNPDLISDAVAALRPGDVILDDDNNRVVVTGVSWRKHGRARIRLVNMGGHDLHWDLSDLRSAPRTVGTLDLPVPFAPARPSFRAEVAHELRSTNFKGPTKPRRQKSRKGRGDPRSELRRAESNQVALEARAAESSGTLARRFDAICEVLRARGHLDGWKVTPTGEVLARVYHEIDLLVVDALFAGVFDDLTGPELASVVSCFTYEHRRPTPAPAPWFPSPKAAARFRDLEATSKDLRRYERQFGVAESRQPEGGFAANAHSWAAGEDLGVILGTDEDLTPGDFVRNVKQLIDLLRQIGVVAPVPATRHTARSAADSIQRGVVALSGAVDVA